MPDALPGIDLILFDCDGTLVDSEIIAAQAWVRHIAGFGVTMTPSEVLDLFRGVQMTACMAEIERRAGCILPAGFESALRALTADMFAQSLRPIDGAVELVQSLAVPFCLASNAPRDKIELCLRLTALTPYFEGRLFSAYDVGKWKPDPGLFLHAAKVMGVAPSRCAVVEDSLPGIEAGVAAGMTVFALQANERTSGVPKGVHVIRKLAELPGYLG